MNYFVNMIISGDSTYLLQVKIQGQNLDMLKAACEQFLGKSAREVHQIALETLVSFFQMTCDIFCRFNLLLEDNSSCGTYCLP